MSSRKGAASVPRIGALLRTAHHGVSQKIAAWLSASPYSDIQPAHLAAANALWERPDGVRLTAMAQHARMTKQSMAALVEHLIKTGYVERTADPQDGRAVRLRLTQRGKTFGTDMRAYGLSLEVAWSKRIGARRVRELRETLMLIVAGDDGG